jgi:hypothetical protein
MALADYGITSKGDDDDSDSILAQGVEQDDGLISDAM